jgi:hypothetical protein
MAYIGAKPINEVNGGTNQATYTKGDTLYSSAANTLAKLPISAIPGPLLAAPDTGLPVWANPGQYVWITDDFMTQGTAGNTGWLVTSVNGGNAFGSTIGIVGHPGIFELFTGTSTNGASTVGLGIETAGNGAVPIGSGFLSMTFVVQIPVLSNGTDTYTVRIGAGSSTNIDQQNGVYFEYSSTENSGAWVIKTANNNTRTTANTSNTVDTNWHKYRIDVNAAGTSVAFYIDGTQVSNSPITTNIPTGNIGPMVMIVKSAGTTATQLYYDLFYMYINLTTPR